MNKYFAALLGCITISAVSFTLYAMETVDGKVLFKDGFDGELQPAWQWVRGDADQWRLGHSELHVQSQPGRIWGGNDAKNILLVRPSKSSDIEARVNVAHSPHEKWEQAGLLWYVDDDNFVKLISEHIDGKMYAVIAREQAGRGRVFGKVEASAANMQLRLVIRANHVKGQWRIKETDAWPDSGECDFKVPGQARIGLFTQNGSKNQVRWVRFDSFMIIDLGKP